MTAGTAVADRLPGVGLLDEQRDEVHDDRPYRETEEQGEGEAEGGVPLGLRRTRARRVQDVTVLSIIAAVQLGWLSILGYGLFVLF